MEYKTINIDNIPMLDNPVYMDIGSEMRLVAFPGKNCGDPEWNHAMILKRIDHETYKLENVRYERSKEKLDGQE